MRWLLLLAIAMVVFIAPAYAQMPETTPDNQALAYTAEAPSQPQVVITYVYQPDAVRLLTEYRRIWTRTHPGQTMTRAALAAESQKAFGSATQTNSQLLSDDDPNASRWSLAGQAHPWTVVPTVAVENPTGEAWLNVDIHAETLAHVGEWLVDDALYLTDDNHLITSGQWMRANEKTWHLPALVPGQSEQWPLPPVNVLALLNAVSEPEQPTHWINQLLVRVTVKAHNLPAQQAETPLTLVPDYFAVPYWY